MQVKIDTREKFTLLTPVTDFLSDIIAADLFEAIDQVKESPVKNLILSLKHVSTLHAHVAASVARTQHTFYEDNISFVVCEMQPDVEAVFETAEILDTLNYTPTESEAWDIVQMEEIERELMDDDNPLFNSLNKDQ